MRKIFAGVFILIFLFILLPPHLSSDEQRRDIRIDTSYRSKLALVIGNASYGFAPLKNPVNDARAVARILKELGFDVIKGENLSQKEMRLMISEFGQRLEREGGAGLFFFSGHGVQVNGNNYLIPVDANIRHENQIEFESVEVGRVLGEMQNARNPLNIVILDACRTSPVTRSVRSGTQGLALMDAPTGTIIAYATAPGKIAYDGDEKYGLYTGELIRWMKEPNLKVEDVFKRVRASVRTKSNNVQIPWESSSLEGDFYFNLKSTLLSQQESEPVELATAPSRQKTKPAEQSVSKPSQSSQTDVQDLTPTRISKPVGQTAKISMAQHPETYIKITDWSFYVAFNGVAILNNVEIENRADIAYKDIKVRVRYYSGAGVQVSGETKILPVTIPPRSKEKYLKGGLVLGSGSGNMEARYIEVLGAVPLP